MTMSAGNIILIGMMCSGKSTAGRALAEMLHLRFLDIDAKAESESGKSIADIFAKDGEDAFRQLESRELSRALQSGGQVIATGGGIVCDTDNIRQMHADNKNAVCYLRAPITLLAKRALADDSCRPLLADCDDTESAVVVLTKLFDKRQSLYEKAAHCFVDIAADDTKSDTAHHIRHAVLSAARFGK